MKEIFESITSSECSASSSQVVERGHDDDRRLRPLRVRRALLRPHVAVALRELHPAQDRGGRREVGDVGGDVDAWLEIPEKKEFG